MECRQRQDTVSAASRSITWTLYLLPMTQLVFNDGCKGTQAIVMERPAKSFHPTPSAERLAPPID